MTGLLITEACSILGIHPQTLRRYEARGNIKARRDINNWRRFDLRDVMRLKKVLENGKREEAA